MARSYRSYIELATIVIYLVFIVDFQYHFRGCRQGKIQILRNAEKAFEQRLVMS